MISGSSNCSAVISVTRIKGARSPGSSTGNVTRRNVVSGDAPDAPLASSNAGSMARSVEVSSRNTNGVEASAWHRIRPPMLKMLIGPESLEAERRADHQIEPSCIGPHQEDPGDGENRRRHQQGKEDEREPDFATGKIGALDEPRQTERDHEYEDDRAGDEDEGVGQDAGIDHGVGEQRADMLERPLRAGLEGEEVGRSAKSREQQHRQRHCDQIDRRAGADGEHQLGGEVEVTVHALP